MKLKPKHHHHLHRHPNPIHQRFHGHSLHFPQPAGPVPVRVSHPFPSRPHHPNRPFISVERINLFVLLSSRHDRVGAVCLVCCTKTWHRVTHFRDGRTVGEAGSPLCGRCVLLKFCGQFGAQSHASPRFRDLSRPALGGSCWVQVQRRQESALNRTNHDLSTIF